jgi:hypothetical protein
MVTNVQSSVFNMFKINNKQELWHWDSTSIAVMTRRALPEEGASYLSSMGSVER